ncbi:hypothetical protein LV780_03765 [Cereibacter azotoformans]|uniref:Uncharacterized protein n=1 Tax=Cereibacter azotoformans TaxID=43057 RepID=A0A2T5JWP2_9RHOB|nr:hypothetical protein [Cereibacter azotoformans]AXQ93004.1 hypothetical protein D0Z66_03755 [Cereibacter sphaeroides]MBO4169307.1 hypothetical protein [Cereibacter azotoformans]PTR14593.1 hypothetical protein C8J28_11665 [Cereibacter azotoformans]UIJ31305.1 hypothetical protein LV780_03765 [Cereibacter azotoformans]
MIADILSRLRGQREGAVGALDALETMRAQIDDAKAEIRRIASAPQPLEDAMAAFDRWADQQVVAAIDGLPTGRLLDPIEARRGLTREAVQVGGLTLLPPEIDNVRGVLLASPTVRAEIRAVVEGQLRDRLNGLEPMDPETRRKKLGRAQADLLALEMAEESAIRMMERAGLPVMRRPDADARALLAADASLPAA